MNIRELKRAIIKMDEKTTEELVSKALEENIDPQEILTKGLIAGMKEVGKLFTRNEYFVPEVLLASEAFYAGFNIVEPILKSQKYQQKKVKVVIGVVEGDIHDIGKNIVKVMFEASGYDIVDLGNDVPTGKFIDTIATEKPTVLALSSLMTTTMTKMEKIIAELEKEQLRSKVKVIVGGAPVNEEFARAIKADGYGKDAVDAVKLIRKLTLG